MICFIKSYGFNILIYYHLVNSFILIYFIYFIFLLFE